MLDSEQEPFSWGFEAGFLRSPVNPRMLLLNRTPEIDCADDGNATGNASAWNLVSVANDLLRVDLSSLFNEIGGHFRERAKLRFYIDLQNAIRTELLDRGIFKPVSTIITQVRVDPFDKAFNHPTKVIGRVMTREEADAEEEKGNHVVPEGDGFRRIIASPKPVDIYEIEALLDAGQIVIAAGGGGIPVMEQGTTLKGASAVIEKDYTAAKLADMVDASHLMILTSKEQMETADGQAIGKISVSDAISLIDENHFDAITTLPKVDASVSFVSSGEGRTAIITKLENAYQGIKERIGTIIK